MIFHVKLHYQLAAFEAIMVLREGDIIDSLVPLLEDVPGRYSVFVERDKGNVEFVMTVEAENVVEALTTSMQRLDMEVPILPEAVEVVGSQEQWRRLGGQRSADQIMGGLANSLRTTID